MDQSNESYANPDAPILHEVSELGRSNLDYLAVKFDCIGHTLYSKTFVVESIEMICEFVNYLLVAKNLTVDKKEMLDRLAVLYEMCLSVPNEMLNFILNDDFSFLLSHLVQLLTNIESVDEENGKQVLVGCFQIFSFIIPKASPNSYLYEILSNLFVRSLFWVNPDLLELSFCGFAAIRHFDPDSSHVICSAFSENESISQIIDFILRNSLRDKLRKDILTFLKNLALSSRKALLLYTPLLCNIFMDNEESRPFILRNISELLAATFSVLGKKSTIKLLSGQSFTAESIISLVLNGIKSSPGVQKSKNNEFVQEFLAINEKLELLLK